MDVEEVRSVPGLELDRYLGLWFEQGRLPLRYEDDDATDVTAEYALADDGTVRVDNRCLDGDGEPTQAVGEAELDTEHAGRLRVTFLPEGLRWIPFTHADYWVLRVDAEYRHALVGTPDRKHLWLLAREPRGDEAVRRDFLETARAQGFDLSDWIETSQSGEVVEI
ncbi:lipocalin family protein [Microbacterium sp. MMO-10]|uniref:lipocalin family protein n=1 Tax=Microbacterium sp. MMO-10 TaxID=3081272 RepID=UPI003017116E